MTAIAIDLKLDQPQTVVWKLRNIEDQYVDELTTYEREVLSALADAIEAAIPKRVIVLDVDELIGPADDTSAVEYLRNSVSRRDMGPLAVKTVTAVAAELERLTSPRPPEPTGRWAVVTDRLGDDWVLRDRGRWQSSGGIVLSWDELSQPVHVESLGVTS